LTTFDSTQTTTSGPLRVNAAQAGDLADRLVGWYLFPVGGEEGKIPLCSWQSNAATGREAVEALWVRTLARHGIEESGVAIATDRSDIFVVDVDRDWKDDALWPNAGEWREWEEALDRSDSLVLRSSHKGRPHYYFKQSADPSRRVVERVWPGGEVKSKGIIVLSSSDPIHQPSASGGGLWTSADVRKPASLLVDLIGVRQNGDESSSGSGNYHRATKEEFALWLAAEPGEHFGGRLIAEEYESSFIEKLVNKFRENVETNGNRRQQCLATIHQAVIESYQGLYSVRAAYDAILEEYENMRTYGPGDTRGDKGWNQRRMEDYQGMWDSEVGKPDALRSAEKSYEELVARLGDSGVNVEISEEDMEEDAYCIGLILSATEEAETVPESVPASVPVPEPTSDDLDWDVPTPDPTPPTVPKGERSSPVVLREEAKQGVLWELVSSLIGQHELPHEALMITLCGWAGCVLGSAGAGYMPISDDRHGPELCVCMVGTSAVSHKSGTVSFGQMVFKEWIDIYETGIGAPGAGSGYFRLVSGVESGQAFIEVWPTAAEIAGGEGMGRSVMMIEKELTTMWKKAARKGSTIPEEIRKAWDGDMLSVRGVRAGNHRVLPANYRFSAVGATIHELAASAIRESGADISGDGNRWLWCWGQEVEKPVKGQPSFDKHPAVEKVRVQVRGVISSIERARQQGQWPGSAIGPNGVPITEFGEPKLWWTKEADQAWLGDEGTPTAGKGIYNDLRDEIKIAAHPSGVVRGLKGRGMQQVMRLALSYEMIKAGDGWANLVRSSMRNDGMAWCISLEALTWACGVWRFCADTVEHLFSDTTGDEKVDELVSAIREMARDQGTKFQGFIMKKDIVGNGFSKNSITALLATSEKQGAIWQGTLRREGRGAQPIVVGLSTWPVPSDVIQRNKR
jgi:hypothetical protein